MIITIGGNIASGKSTMAKMLSQKLWYKHISIGDMKRTLAKEMGLDIYEFDLLSTQPGNEQKFDKIYEEFQQGLDPNENIILDSRLWFYCVPSAIKFFLTIDPENAAKRIYHNARDEDDYKSIAKNQEMAEKRHQLEKVTYKKLYNVDPRDMSHYDLVIDTSTKSIEEVYNEIIWFIETRNNTQ